MGVRSSVAIGSVFSRYPSIITAVENLNTVREALGAAKIEVRSADLVKLPKTPKTLGGQEAVAGMNLVEALEDHDDVQKVFTDFEPDSEALANL